MAQQYAKDQPAGFKNRIENIAIVGASGTVGKFFVEHLLKTGKHKITAITRADSTNTMPAGVEVKKVDYKDHSSLVNALKGQDAFIITMGAFAGSDGSNPQDPLVSAALEAGVPWVIPNEYGGDPDHEKHRKETMIGAKKDETRRQIQSSSKSSWIGFSCGYWYEFSLAGQKERYGFDIPRREVYFIDDGNTKINTSTWPQCGRAMANLLSLKVLPDDENDKSPTLSQFRNRPVYIASFTVSQKDMFESLKRVTGTADKDWTISYEPHQERYDNGLKRLKAGDMLGFGQAMYTRSFFPDLGGNFGARVGLHNDILGLPTEDLDPCTKSAVEMAMNQQGGYGEKSS